MKIRAQIGSIYAKKQKPTNWVGFLLFSKTIIILENNIS
jgi:hypothetical protein